MTEIRFYFDESVELVVSEQLAAGGLDIVSAHSLNRLGDSDDNHLRRATAMNRVLCTYDTDFLVLAQTNPDHAGIIFAPQYKVSIGGWVKELRAIHARFSAAEIKGQVIYLSAR